MWKPLLLIVVGTLAVVTAGFFALKRVYARPVMPAITVRLASSRASPLRSLILIYGERGSDPFRSGKLAADQRITHCDWTGESCFASPARDELRFERARTQSLQVRAFDGHGNPIIGGISWYGPAFPKHLDVTCDPLSASLRRACRLVRIEN